MSHTLHSTLENTKKHKVLEKLSADISFMSKMKSQHDTELKIQNISFMSINV